MMALGHGPAKLDEKGVRGQHDYASRVIRDKRYKVWVDTDRRITELYDLQTDPWEQKNLIASDAPPHLAAKQKFQRLVDAMPAQDARPKYRPRPSQPWERPLPEKDRRTP
jgi:arylsulfatase A-like enzyme